MFRWFISLCLLSVAFVTGCDRSKSSQASRPARPQTNQQIFEVKGVVIAVKPKEKSIQIKHEEIPGYMPAMTMPFDVKDVRELDGVKAGDSVSFRMLVTDTEGWIEQIRKISPFDVPSSQTNAPVTLLKEVQPLNVGEPLPEYHFTNQFGQPIATTQFKGKALAITFLFTRCPFPTFCPLIANHFAEVQQKLLATNNAPSNWHLLTISFDPDFDTPPVLKAYAERYKYDPNHSSFATGSLTDITTLGEQIGLSFQRDSTGSISHNLRTLVVDTSGKVQKILVGNNWSSDELVDEIVKAAK